MKAFLLFCLAIPVYLTAQVKVVPNIKHVDCYFENASPLRWEIQGDTIVKISLTPDYEREVFNRQTTHWHFRMEAEKGQKVRLILSKALPDIYNGKLASGWWNFEHDIPFFISYDQKTWEAIATSRLPNYELLAEFVMKTESVYIARIPPYTEKDLKLLLDGIKENPLVKIIPIGFTVEKRPLEVIRLGNPDAKHSILIRARAHPWETGGNWVVEGLIAAYLENIAEAVKWRDDFCYYIMPMANKDGVARGLTRFNVAGKDLNRNWLNEADSTQAPENYAFENFVTTLIALGHKPALAVDLHNDDYGDIHLTLPKDGDNEYLKKMEMLGSELKKQTWFSKRLTTKKEITGGGNMADGMYHKFDIDAFVFEFDANYIESLGKIPEASDWKNLGAKLNSVFSSYLDQSAIISVSLQHRIPAETGEDTSLIELQEWSPDETAVIVCDMWDEHWCKGATERVSEMAPFMNKVISKARSKGVMIIHAPSDCMEYYEDFQGRKLAEKYKIEDIEEKLGSGNLQSESGAVWPIQISGGGCDCHPQCKNRRAWTKQISTIEIFDEDVISDSGVELGSLFIEKGIRNVILLGVHTNMCVINRSFGLRNMKRLGMNVVLMRDMTDTMYDSASYPYVSHFEGTRLVCGYIEKYVCSTMLSTDFTGGDQFWFKNDVER